MRAAHRMPLRVARQRSRRQARASGLTIGWPGTGRQRVLRAKAAKAKNKMPAVNLERRAQASARANSAAFLRLGFCHTSPKHHNVIKVNRVIAISVWTIAANARKAGVLT